METGTERSLSLTRDSTVSGALTCAGGGEVLHHLIEIELTAWGTRNQGDGWGGWMRGRDGDMYWSDSLY